MSYCRFDDRHPNNDITWLREQIENAVRSKTGVPFKIFQDKVDIRHGEKWENTLNVTLEDVQLFIPILTPSFFKSDHCLREIETFLDYEMRSGRDDLILPIQLIRQDLPSQHEKKENELKTKLSKYNVTDLHDFRHNLRSLEIRLIIDGFASSLAIAATRSEKKADWIDIYQRAVREGHHKTEFIDPNQRLKNRQGVEPEDPLPYDEIQNKSDGSHLNGMEDGLLHEDKIVALEKKFEELNDQIRNSDSEVKTSHAGLALPKKRWWLVAGLCFLSGLIATYFLGFNQTKRPSPEEVVAGAKGPPETETSEPSLGKRAETINPLPVTAGQQKVSETVPSTKDAAARSLNQAPRDCSYCPEMIPIRAGTFSMGSPDNEDGHYSSEGPLREVTIDRPFELGKYEVTRAEFGLFVTRTGHEATGCTYHDGKAWVDDPNLDWRHPGYEQTDDDPVVCVNWDDARAYARWLSEETGETYRLPSEAEWEYAARAGRSTSYFWGEDTGEACDYANGYDRKSKDVIGLPYAAFPCDDGYARTAPVGSFYPNSLGLHDMTGNVWEWVEDSWHDNYLGAPADGRAWIEANDRSGVLRGGAWRYNPRSLRSANRRKAGQDIRTTVDGFRIARTPGR